MRFVKGMSALLLTVLLCVPMTGCRTMELYERLLIHGIGVDKNANGYTVTVRSSASSGDEGEECFVSEGATVLDALNNLSLTTGREPFFSHNYLVVFGMACAKEGLDRTLDFFVRYYNTRPAVKMFLAENTAQEVVAIERDGKYRKMSELQQLAESHRYNGKTVDVDVLQFVNGVKREGSSAYLPVLRAEEAEVGMIGTAYFDGYRYKGMLSLEETRGLLAAQGEISYGEVVVSDEAFGTVTLSLSQVDGTVRAEADGEEQPRFVIRVSAEADISAASGGRSRMESSLYGKLEEAVAKTLQQQVEAALQQAVLQDSCDIFGFGNLLFQQNPTYWESLSRHWKTQMTTCTYQVEVTAKVLRIEQEDLNYGGRKNTQNSR